MTRRMIHLNGYLVPWGHHPSAWQLPDASYEESIDPARYLEYARYAEEHGLFDSLFLSDSQHAVPMGGATERPNNVFEPLTLLSYLAGHTSRIGLIATVSSSFSDPYNIARQLSSIQLLSKGRAGINLVTSVQQEAALNHSMPALPERELRYARAAEFADVLKKLWSSWTPQAIAMDKEANRYFDSSGFTLPHHVGEYFQVDGAINVPGGFGDPIIVQAGASEQGMNLAARYAEAIYGAGAELADAQSYYEDVKARTLLAGRQERDIAVMPGIVPIIGETRKAAQEKKDYLDSFMSVPRRLSILGKYLGLDCSAWDLNDAVPALPPLESYTGSKGRYAMLKALSEENGRTVTVGKLLSKMSAGNGHFTVVGTPSDIADKMIEWFDGRAADGFNVSAPTSPDDFTYFIDTVVPILQERGYFRTSYEGSTLRSHLRQELA